MGMNSRRIKNRAIEICESDDYEVARDVEFRIQIAELLGLHESALAAEIDEGEIQTFVDNFSTNFPDEDTWCMDKACGEYEDFQESKYEQMKDERMEREDG